MRLTKFTVIGTLVGAAVVGEILLMQLHGYDHGHGESERCSLAGGVVGAFVGVGAELFLRLFDNDLRVSMRDLMQLTAGLEFAFGASAIAIPLLRAGRPEASDNVSPASSSLWPRIC